MMKNLQDIVKNNDMKALTRALRTAMKSDKFFQELKARDVLKQKRIALIAVSAALVISLVSNIILGFIMYAQLIQPVPVIAFDKKGKMLAFPADETREWKTNDVRIRAFLERFLKLYAGFSPQPKEDLTKALNMMVGKIVDIEMREDYIQNKIDKFTGSKLQSSAEITDIKITGGMEPGESIYAYGIARLDIESIPLKGIEDLAVEERTQWVFFQIRMGVYEYTKLSPWGLRIDYKKLDFFQNKEELETLLMKNDITFEETEGVAE